jgi:2-oxoglutarate dehydrogenase E1 component
MRGRFFRALPSAPFPFVMQRRAFTDAQTVASPHPFDQAVQADNAEYIEELKAKFLANSKDVDPSWHPLLTNLLSGKPDACLVESFSRPISSTSRSSAHSVTEKERVDNMRLAWMIRAYEKEGHHLCSLDPLNLFHADLNSNVPDSLNPAAFGFTESDLDRTFIFTPGNSWLKLLQATKPTETVQLKLRDIISHLNAAYCSRIGFEYMGTGYQELRQWFRSQIAETHFNKPTNEARIDVFKDVVRACGLESFLHKKYATHKRFGLEGAEALIPAMNVVIDECAKLGAESAIMGMPHRGRLNVLVNVCGKPIEGIFNEFAGKKSKDNLSSTGDVKYHLGIQKDVQTVSGKTVNINLLANPSHLEAVNPLVMGKTRARQLFTKDTEYTKTVPILLHGDAAFAGQGSCYEIMGFCELESFHVGGTIHIVVNNQIGFTTNPAQSRSSMYCTDLSKVNNAPVIHVNADDINQVVRAARIAANFRQTYKRDCIIDLVCYRRRGHNESDDATFTQPLMYSAIAKTPTLVEKVAAEMVADGILTKDQTDLLRTKYEAELVDKHATALLSDDFVSATSQLKNDFLEESETDYTNSLELSALRKTAIPLDSLIQIGEKVTAVPEGFQMHPTVKRTYEARRKAIDARDGVEWCLAESLAFGALAMEGIHVRVSGQDVERGTFTQRHAVVTNYKTGEKYCSLNKLAKVQAPVSIANSSLSEFGVCGFELGYAMENPKSLVIWEAQFGDFSNGAQTIFDQFLASGEAKWDRQCGLCISLPHGYSGAGPEHSSARIERFLQLSDDAAELPDNLGRGGKNRETRLEERIRRGNWQVCYPSTPANYYHMLRRQIHRSFRKPLIFFFSKARLRAPNVSSLAEMATGTIFLPIIDCGVLNTSGRNIPPRKVILCTGQIGQAVVDAHAKLSGGSENDHNVAIVRLEQIAPFPWEHLMDTANKYIEMNPDVEFEWLQEEPKNMGCWHFVRPRLRALLETKGKKISCIGRDTAASPSTGYTSVHNAEEQQLIDAVFRV